jgi:ATP-dependent helicase/nuclease subunit A
MRKHALLRGTLVHRLLQSLPDLAPTSRREAALKYLARNADGWSGGDRETLAEKLLALIEDARFAPVFAQGSRAEVSIAGRLDRPGRPPALVSGQIDRLVVTPAEVLIVDYKTNHAPPGSAAETPSAYVHQLALYRAVLAKLYPARAIRAALLWTETADLMEISAPALDAALGSLHLGVTKLDPGTPRSEVGCMLFAAILERPRLSRTERGTRWPLARFLTPISKLKCSTPPARWWLISGPNGAAPAA